MSSRLTRDREQHDPDTSLPACREVREREHLTTDTTGRRVEHGVTQPREAICDECGARVTVGPDGSEYGHARCEYRDTERFGPTRPNGAIPGGDDA